MEHQLLVRTYIHTYFLTQTEQYLFQIHWGRVLGMQGAKFKWSGMGKKRDTKIVNPMAFHMDTRIQEIWMQLKQPVTTLLQSKEKSGFGSVAFLSKAMGAL